jgi:hypothetical protein
MTSGRMDAAAAARISKARGNKDDFAKRAAWASKQNQQKDKEKAQANDGSSGARPSGGRSSGGGSV